MGRPRKYAPARRRAARPRSSEQECTRCGESKPLEEFVRDRSRSSGHFPWCKACVKLARAESPERVTGEKGERECPVCHVGLDGTHANRRYCSDRCKLRARALEVYGLSQAEYEALIADTDGRCPICRRRIRKWAIDHDHATGEVTGATCHNCNINLLGYVGHDPEVADRLAAYLREPPVRRLFGERRYVGPERVSQLHRRWAWSREREVPDYLEDPPGRPLGLRPDA